MRLAGLCHQAVSRAIVDDPVGQPLQFQQFDRRERQPPVLEQRHARRAAEHQVAQVRAHQPAAAGEVVEDLVESFAREGWVVVGEYRQIRVLGKHGGDPQPSSCADRPVPGMAGTARTTAENSRPLWRSVTLCLLWVSPEPLCR